MSKIDQKSDLQVVFGTLLLVANRIDTQLERELAEFGLTARQWLLAQVLFSMFDQPPTIKEVARLMGSSHQNIKQVALKLVEKNLLALVKDPFDGRVTRLNLIHHGPAFWASTDEKGAEFTRKIFQNVDDADLAAIRRVLHAIWSNLDQMA